MIKRFTQLFLTIFSGVFITLSCSTDLDLVTDWEEGMAVYGLLSPQDSVHYIRINRIFLDPETNALSIAQIPDSIYYGDELEIKVSAFPNGPELIAQRMNATDVGMDKNEGVFSDQPNILYRLEHVLDPDKRYQIDVTNGETGYHVSGSTHILGDVTLTFPTNIHAYQFNLLANNQRVSFRTAEHGKTYQVILRFNYEEWDIQNPTAITQKHVDWTVFNQLVSSGTSGGVNMTENNFPISQIYNILGNQIPEDPMKRRRVRPNGCLDIIFVSGGEELYHFMRAESAQSGLTSGSAPPRYTNIDDGYGLWSSRNKNSFPNWQISLNSIDSLSCSQLTRHLNFADRDGFFDCD